MRGLMSAEYSPRLHASAIDASGSVPVMPAESSQFAWTALDAVLNCCAVIFLNVPSCMSTIPD